MNISSSKDKNYLNCLIESINSESKINRKIIKPSLLKTDSNLTPPKPPMNLSDIVPRRPINSTSKIPSSTNSKNNQKSYYVLNDCFNGPCQISNNLQDQIIKIEKDSCRSLIKSSHFNSTESLVDLNGKKNGRSDIDYKSILIESANKINDCSKKKVKIHKNNSNQSLSSLVTSSSTSGFVSGTTSVTNSSSFSSKSNDSSAINGENKNNRFNSKNQKFSELKNYLLINGSNNNSIKEIPTGIKSGSVSSARSIYELKSFNNNMNSSSNTNTNIFIQSNKNRKYSYQPSSSSNCFLGTYLNTTNNSNSKKQIERAQLYNKSNKYDDQSQKNNKSSNFSSSSKQIQDRLSNPNNRFFSNNLTDSSRHPSLTSNSNKLVVTPRNSTSTYIRENNQISNQQRRLSYNYNNFPKENQKQHSRHQSQSNWVRHSSNYNENKEDENEMINDMDIDLNYDDYDDDLFEEDDKVVTQTLHNKQYHNSQSTASYIASQINCLALNPENITPDTSDSSISSSSLSPVDVQKTRMLSEKILLKNNNNKMIASLILHNNGKNNNFNKLNNQIISSTSSSTNSGKIENNNIISSSSSSSYSNSSAPVFKSSEAFSPDINMKNDPRLDSNNLIYLDDINTVCIPKKKSFPSLQKSPLSLSARTTILPPPPPPLPHTSQSAFLIDSTNIDHSLMNSLSNFSHFDIQSVFFNYEHVKLVKMSLFKSVNIKTGASAASRQSSLDSLEMNKNQNLKSTNDLTNSFNKTTSGLFVNLDESSSSDFKSKTNIQNFSEPNSSEEICGPILVEECPCFRIEAGGDTFKGLGLVEDVSQRRMMKLNSISILDRMKSYYKKEIIDNIETNNNEPFMIEFQDWGSYFYRYYFNNQDHSNYLGMDPQIGPVVISIRRDKMPVDFIPPTRSNSDNSNKNNHNDRAYEYAYRIILRTVDLNALRGTILENQILTKASISNSKGIHHKELISYLFNQIDLNCLRLAESKVSEKLIELDEQYIIKNHKIGVLLCKAGQSTEEEFYNNRESTPSFDEFLQLLGDKIRLKGFTNYRGGLDNTSDTTGTHSVYTKFRDKEIMFHISTLLPYSNNDQQQLTRKRHIGNDLVTIIFQEPGSLPFSPKTIRSQYQHIFIIVRAIKDHKETQYSVAVSYSKDVPYFGPPLPKNPLFVKSKEFRDFLLAKIVNADNVGLRCEKFTQIRMRNRHGALKDIIENFSSKTSIENTSLGFSTNSVVQKFGLFNFGSIKQKKIRSKSLHMFNSSLINTNDDDLSNAIYLLKLNGAIFWNIDSVEDYQYKIKQSTYLGISRESIVLVDPKEKSVLFSVCCNAIIGWTIHDSCSSFVLYFDQGEYINITFRNRSEMNCVIKRLEYFTKGCKTTDLCLEKKDYGPLGLNIHHDGVVTEVEPYSLAYYRGLKQGTRIVKIGDSFVINLNHEKMIDLLRKSNCLKVTFLAPFEDGSPRTGQDETYSLYAYLSTCSSLNERLIDSIKTPLLSFASSSSNSNRNKKVQLSSFSPQKCRRLTNVSNITKLLNRLSTSSSIKEDLNDEKHGNSFTNTLYGQSDEFGLKEISNSNSNSDSKNLNLKNTTFCGSSNPCKVNSNAEWTQLVQTASKTFQNIHRQDCNFSDTNEGYKNSQLNHDENDSTYDVLKGKLFQLQTQLNQEKFEKSKYSSKIAHILEENKNLKEELSKVKDQINFKYRRPSNRNFENEIYFNN